jgi:hypothetical protein
MAPLDKALEKAKNFIRELNATPSSTGLPLRIEIMFSAAKDGSISISGEIAQKYRDAFNSIYADLPKNTLIDRKTLERLFRNAVLAAVDINERREERSFEKRIAVEIEKLRNKLNSPPIQWVIYCSVAGVEVFGTSVSLGGVSFTPFTQELKQRLLDISTRSDDEEERRQVEHDLRVLAGNKDENGVVGIIKMKAIDPVAARSAALQQMRLTVDILNFFSDVLYRQGMTRIILPGEQEHAALVTWAVSEEEPIKFSYGYQNIGAFGLFSINKLVYSDPSETGIDIIQRILVDSQHSEFESRLLAAIQWAGRATVEPRIEEAFLLYAIALESLVMPREVDADISYRLRIFVPHLLGLDLPTRVHIKSEITQLYKMRSEIVHRGRYTISSSDLSQIRWYTKNSVLRMLTQEPFKSMKTDKELREWFDNQVLQ